MRLNCLFYMKIFYSSGDSTYGNWIPDSEKVHTIEESDLVLFTGGEDVTPSYYKEEAHRQTYYNTRRDEIEIAMFKRAIELNKPILGVCRGSQLSCVMAGGKLVQHQNNPGYIHEMVTYNGVTIPITSTHHQAQYPFNLPEDNYKILGWSEGLIRVREDGNHNHIEVPKDCEVVYYPKIRTLGIQGHPEMIYGQRGSEPTIQWCRELLLDFINGNLD